MFFLTPPLAEIHYYKMPTLSNGFPLLAENCSSRTLIVTVGILDLGQTGPRPRRRTRQSREQNLAINPVTKAEIKAAASKLGAAEVCHLDLASYDPLGAVTKGAGFKPTRINTVIKVTGVLPSKRTMARRQ